MPERVSIEETQLKEVRRTKLNALRHLPECVSAERSLKDKTECVEALTGVRERVSIEEAQLREL